MAQKTSSSRVSPTVKSQPMTNRRSLKNWELRFGIIPLVSFVGLVCGSLVVSFYFGYLTGQKEGLEIAQSINLQNEPRIPVVSEDGNTGDEHVSDLYAKLSEKAKPSKLAAESEARAGVDLSVVKSIEDSPAVLPPTTEINAKGKNSKEVLVLEDEGPAIDDNKIAAAHNESLDDTLGDPLDPKSKSLAGTKKGIDSDAPIKTLASVGATAKESAVTTDKKSEYEKVTVAKLDSKTSKTETKTESVKTEKPAAVESVAAKEKAPALEEETTKPGTSNFTKKVLSKGWFAQVAAPRKLKDADDVARKLKSSGFVVAIETAKVRGEEYFRVVVGPEETREQADRLVSQLKRENYLKGDPFVRVVK